MLCCASALPLRRPLKESGCLGCNYLGGLLPGNMTEPGVADSPPPNLTSFEVEYRKGVYCHRELVDDIGELLGQVEAEKVNEAVMSELRGIMPALPAGSTGDVSVNLLVYDRSGRASAEKVVMINSPFVAPPVTAGGSSGASGTPVATGLTP